MAEIKITKRGLKIFTYSAIGLVTIWVICSFFFRANSCGGIVDNFTISEVEYGEFSEWIPQNGVLTYDSINQALTKIKVDIDELYLSKISKGLEATSDINGMPTALEIVQVYPSIVNGRFKVDMKFVGEVPSGISEGYNVRMRIELGKPSNEILLPLGVFYKDTGGTWVFVIKNGTTAVKHAIKLGRKNSNYFEVLEGLRPGDRVITSSYKEFINQRSMDISELLLTE